MKRLMITLMGTAFCCAQTSIAADAIGSGKYVTDGLVAQWDGVDNVGTGVHDPSATVWRELVSRQDLPLNAADTVGDAFISSASAHVLQNVFDVKTSPQFTLEVVVRPTGDYPSANKSYVIVDAADRAAIEYDTRSEGGIMLYYKNSSVTTLQQKLYSSFRTLGGSIASQLAKNLPYAYSATFTNALPALCVNGESFGVGGTDGASGGWYANSSAITIGGDSRTMDIYTVRVYDKILTPEQRQMNLLVDRLRFGLFDPSMSFSHDATTGKMTVWINVPSDIPVSFDLHAEVRDLGEGGATVDHVLGTSVPAGPASYNIPGLNPGGRYEVTIKWHGTIGGEAVVQDLRTFTVPSGAGEETGDIYQAAPSAAIGNPDDWALMPSSVRRAPKAGDRLFVGLNAGDYLLRMSGADCRLENLNEFAGVTEVGVTSRVEVLDGAYLSTTNGFTLGAREGSRRSKSTLLISGGKVDVGGSWFSGPHSDGTGTDSSSTIRIENGGELNLDNVTTTTTYGDVAVLQPNGKEPLDFTISTGGVLRANNNGPNPGKRFICACSSQWRTGVKGGGDNFNFTLDGGQIIATNTTFDTQGAIVRVKGGSWYAYAFRPTYNGVSRYGKLLMSGGTMTLSSDLTLNYCGKEPVCLSGGSLRMVNLICQNEPRIIRITGGTFNVSYTVKFANSGLTGGRCWFKIIGSDADITVESVDKHGSTTPVFWDYRFDSTARPGGPGVAPCKKTGYNKVVHGHYRISPYGGFQLVSTNVFPLVVQTAKRALEKGTTDGAKFATTYHDDLWDFPLPSGSSVLSAVLKEDAAIEDGKTLASGRVRGYLQLPPIRNPARCQGVTVRMNVVPQGTNTLEGIVAEIAEQYPGAARIEKGGYNVEVPLPLERLAPGDANKVVFDFSTIASVADAENGTVTTNALVTTIAAKVKKPGMILMFY